MQNNQYFVKNNGDQFEVEWTARNISALIDATGVIGTFTLPVAGLSYVSHTVAPGNGVFNPSLGIWTIGNIYRKGLKSIKIKYSVDDISLLNMVITQALTLNESDAILENNLRRVFVSKVGDVPCNPESFITPSIQISDDDLYERVYVGGNDTVICPCCTKGYNLVANSSINVNVISITKDGWANIVRINPKKDSYFDYTVTCDNCADGNPYSSFSTATVKINRLFTDPTEYEGFVTLRADGGPPTVYVNNNEFPGTIVWTRVSGGDYRATLAGAFTWNHTNIFITPDYNTPFNIDGGRISENQLAFTHEVGGVIADPVDDVVFNILIRVRRPAIPLSPTISVTPTITPSVTSTISITPSITSSISVTRSISVTPSVTKSISVTPSTSV